MKLFARNIQFSFRLKTLIFPLDGITFMDELTNAGFTQARKGQQTPDGMPVQQGDLVMKGNSILGVNSLTQIFSITTTRHKEIIPIYDEIIPMLAKSGVNVETNALAYSVLCEYNIITEKNALEQINAFSHSFKKIELFDKIIGGKSALFGIIIVPDGKPVTDENYYQLRIEPFMTQQGKTYFFQYSERNTNKDKMLKLADNLEEFIQSLINEIEK